MDNKDKPICADDIEKYFNNNLIKISCPECDSLAKVKAGKYHSGIQCYKCIECGKRYSALSNTIFEGTDYSWEEIVNIIYYIATKKSIDYICKNIRINELSRNKVWIVYHKILSVLAQMYKPILTDKILIGNIYIKESQKGSKKLHSVIDDVYIRKPRNHSSNNSDDFNDFEYMNILCASDNHNHFYAKCICLGQPTLNELEDLNKYIKDPVCFYLEDLNPYFEWCKQFGRYFEVLPKESCDKTKTFYEELKNEIVSNKKNITSQYLNDYVGTYTYLKNYQLENNITSFSLKDAEDILIRLCRYTKEIKHSPTKDEIMAQDITLLPKPDYKKLKQAQRENIKNAIDNQYIKNSKCQQGDKNKNDIEYSFDSRKFLNQIGIIRINQLVKQYDLYHKGMNKKQKIDVLLKLPNIEDIIYYEANRFNEEIVLKSIVKKKKTSE